MSHHAQPGDPAPGALVGRWRSEGHIVGDSTVPITGTDSYEWLPGGFFPVYHVDVVFGDQQVQVLELIGDHDPATDSYTARAYDNLGNITVMQARVDEQGVWRFTGGGNVAAVAEVLAYVYQLRSYNKQGGAKPQQPAEIPVPEGMDILDTTE